MTSSQRSTSSNQQRLRVGILGGTFDPPHLGHLKLAQHFSKALQLDHLIWVPSGQSWQKNTVSASHHRFTMTRLLAAEMNRLLINEQQPVGPRTQISVSNIEVMRTGPSYTIDTLRALRTQFGEEASLSFLMGMDQLLHLTSWHSWSSLFDYSHLCVASRPAYHCPSALDLPFLLQSKLGSADLVQSSPYGVLWLDTQLDVDLSSTTLRPLLRQTQTNTNILMQWLAPTVLEYIEQQQLYRLS